MVILIQPQRQLAFGQRGLAGEQPGGRFVEGREARQRPAGQRRRRQQHQQGQG
ncbi:hypothetical protein ACKUSW_13415 [Serratia marcescens]